MEKIVRKFSSFQEADEADYREYATMTGNQRLIRLYEILSWQTPPHGPLKQRLEGVFRIIKHQRG